MLSMISIDCVSGDTATCGLHLNGCEQLIRSARKSKTKYSPKARALHRIFFYLRTIHASTTLEKPGLMDACDQAESSSLPEENRFEEATEDDNDWLDMQESSDADMTSCEYIYGIPQTINSGNYVYFLAYQQLLSLRELRRRSSTPRADAELETIVTGIV